MRSPRRFRPTGLPSKAPPPQKGLVVWLTGLSGAGKSTIAYAAAAELAQQGVRIEILDGDLLRQGLSRDLGFSKADRDEHVARVGFVANVLSRFGAVVFVALVSPYAQARNQVRRNTPRFLEVYVDAPLRICEQRDVKGLYRLARQGELQAFTGVSDPYEPPASPDVVCRTDQESVTKSVERVLGAVCRALGRYTENRTSAALPMPAAYISHAEVPVLGR